MTKLLEPVSFQTFIQVRMAASRFLEASGAFTWEALDRGVRGNQDQKREALNHLVETGDLKLIAGNVFIKGK